MAPSISWIKIPFGFIKANKEREIALKELTEKLTQVENDLEQSKRDLESARESVARLEASQTVLLLALQEKQEASKELEDSLTDVKETLEIERATNSRARSELERHGRTIARMKNALIEEDERATAIELLDQDSNVSGEQPSSLDPIIGLPYISIIIDGDTESYMFPYQLYAQGLTGGETAARMLDLDARKYINSQPDCPRYYDLHVQIILNFEGAVSHRGPHFGQSLRGFLRSGANFDVIDSGHGKERADFKIRAKLLRDVPNRACSMVIFGGCHDAGYIPVLSEYVRNGTMRSKLRLLLPQQLFLQYRNFGLKWVEFPSIFPRCTFASIDANGKLAVFGKSPPFESHTPKSRALSVMSPVTPPQSSGKMSNPPNVKSPVASPQGGGKKKGGKRKK